MPAITWGPQLEIGIAIIDKQHRHWVDLFNNLSDAVRAGHGEEAIGKTLEELLDYSISHFRTEEGLMQAHDYADLDAHMHEHLVFTDQIQIFRDRVDLKQWTLSLEVLDYMQGWLVEHITASDRAYQPTLVEAGVT